MALTQISRSLRFNSADSAYLNRTPASAGNRDTWTWSAWVKRSALATNVLFFAGTLGSNDSGIYFGGNNNLDFFTRTSSSLQGYIQTPAVFRDVSAWYHIVAVYDSGNATSADRMILYVNGTRQTVTVNNTLPQNTDSFINSNVAHQIGSYGSDYLDGYLTEINFIDGQALTPSSFGFNSSDTGVWSPKQYTGPFGTNGFYVNFSDNSDTTSTTLGKDYSGNGNNWTPNNFSVAAGAGNDSMVDSPTAYGTDTGVGGSIRGNYCTMNPLAVAVTSSISTLANGNLDVTTAVSGQSATFATISLPSSGKWYWEVTPTGVSAGSYIGIAVFAVGANYFTGGTALFYAQDGTKYVNSANSAYGATYTTNDVIGVAVDVDGGTVTFYKNNSSQGSISYSSGTLTPFLLDGNSSASSSFTANFGQRAFAYTAPSGFKALCTTNLPTPTIGATSTTQANDYFNTVLYTGTGSSLGVTGVGFQPDWVWIKERSGAADHGLYDAVRGVQNQLESNTTTAETTEATGLTAFGTDGFTVGALAQLNTSADTYVAWNWNAGGSNATNTSGTITSTVRANQTSGFSIVTYTGTSTTGTIGHGLGVAPSMIIVKARSVAADWAIYHVGLPNNTYSIYFDTGGQNNAVNNWNSTSPTSSVFTVIGTSGYVNTSPRTYVAYCFAPVAGYSAFGSYTGNGATDGAFVYTGFRPRYVMIKRSDSTSDWTLLDTSRSTYNVVSNRLWANLADAEITNSSPLDIVSNGFKLRITDAYVNANTGTYIYAAFAEFPFKFSLAR
jgi:hypothetical protein